jgi:asparagine N-glycosylation enzyme membrane subunit Stt3
MYLSARPLDAQPAGGLGAFSWPVVVVPAVVLGVLFGVVIGLAGRRRTARWGPLVAVVVCALVALLPLSLPLAQLGGSDSTASTYLVASLTGWVLYHLLATGLATLLASPSASSPTGRGLRPASPRRSG